MNKNKDNGLWVEPVKVSPIWAAVGLGCLASVLLFVLVWFGLIAAMASGELVWSWWPYLAVPLAVWSLVLGLPLFLRSWTGASLVLDTFNVALEAWLARADRVIEQEAIIPPPKVRVVRPLLVGGGQPALMPKDVPLLEADHPPLWECPDGTRVPQDVLTSFVDGAFTVGISRGVWVGAGKSLDREMFEGCIALLEQASLIEGRKSGFAGKLTVRSSSQAKGVLGLPRG